jgi:hypothetical protein
MSAGRPRKSGARFPGGKLKPTPVEPNARVMADRERLMGSLSNLEKADHPMDLAQVRGWLTGAQHRAGMTYARLYRQAQLGAPGMERATVEETPAQPIDVQAKGLQDWTDAETAAVFDAVFNRTPPSGAAEAANAKLRTLNALLTPDERAEVTKCFVHASWPWWVTHRAAGHFDTPHERKRDLLVRGLDTIAAAMKPARADKPAGDIPFSAMAPAPEPTPQGPKLNHRTTFVDEDGQPTTSQAPKTKALKEVVIKRRAATREG